MSVKCQLLVLAYTTKGCGSELVDGVQQMVLVVSNLLCVLIIFAATNLPRLETIENCMRVAQMLVQGLWETKSPLLQLPHLTQDCLRHFTTKKVSSPEIFTQLAQSCHKKGVIRIGGN